MEMIECTRVVQRAPELESIIIDEPFTTVPAAPSLRSLRLSFFCCAPKFASPSSVVRHEILADLHWFVVGGIEADHRD